MKIGLSDLQTRTIGYPTYKHEPRAVSPGVPFSDQNVLRWVLVTSPEIAKAGFTGSWQCLPARAGWLPPNYRHRSHGWLRHAPTPATLRNHDPSGTSGTVPRPAGNRAHLL